MVHGLENSKFKNCENVVTLFKAMCLPECEYTNNNQMQQWLNKIEEQLSDNIVDLVHHAGGDHSEDGNERAD